MTNEQKEIVYEIMRSNNLEAFKLACSAYTKNEMIDCMADVTTGATTMFDTRVFILWTYSDHCYCRTEKKEHMLGNKYDLDIHSNITIDRQKALIRARELYNRVNRQDGM